MVRAIRVAVRVVCFFDMCLQLGPIVVSNYDPDTVRLCSSQIARV